MDNESPIIKIAQEYKDHPVLTALIQLITPYVYALDTLLMTHLQSFRDSRLIIFFDELADVKIELRPDLLVSENFLHCCFDTVRAAINTHRREKIKMFARLLNSYTIEENFASIDEYEDYLRLLQDITYREYRILATLDKYEARFPLKEDENEGQRINRLWNHFTDELITELGLPKDEINDIMARVSRTGCYELLRTYTMGSKGKLTPSYFRLKKMVEVEKPSLL